MRFSLINMLFPAICLALGSNVPVASAGPAGYCGKSGGAHWAELREALVGHWRITHHSGYALAGGMVIPFPASPQDDGVVIALIGDELAASHPEMQAPMILTLADEPRWTMDLDDPRIPKPSLTLADLELVVGCGQMDLPRIIGTTSAVAGGARMDFVNRFVLVDESTLYGVMEMNTVAQGTPVTARRTVSLIRDGAP